ncbi:MAG TPA: ABC transporter ATP-binding protein/permease [Firmicutes bacterium]|nr:ABC transporter ATP-binding protein/permease [Bacillota bacterium]
MKQSGNTAGTLRRLLRYVGRYKGLMTGVFLSALVGNAALLLAPKLVGRAIDLILPGGDASFFPALLKMLGVIGTLYLVGCGLTWIAALCANVAANRTVRDLRVDLFDKLGRLPLKFYDANSRGDVMSRFTNDIDAIADGLNQGIPQLTSGVITVILSLAFMLTLNPWVTLVVVFVTPLCFFAGYFITKYGSKRFREQQKALGKLNGYAEEMISGQRTVKAFGYEERETARFGEINGELYDCGYRAQFASALVNPSTRFVNNIAYVLVGVFGILAVLRGALTTGGVASFLTYTAQFSKPFNEITSITMQLQLAMASARRVFAVLDEAEQDPEPPSVSQLLGARGAVQFRDVSFSYTPDRKLIEDFCLQVKPGETIAIVGPTGAGKTTLVNLLMRFYEVDGGQIYVDGREITGLTRDSLRRSFGMVLQETWLFSGTVRDNIAYGKPDATDEEVEAAARAAHAHSFIRRLPQGYRSMISEDGGNLSQGQKQLLTIARAMLLNPPMLILDEATSSVDILTEMRIQRAFRKLMKGKTTFIIAHRLSTIRDADRILVLDKGNVVEQGSHEELLARGGFYANLYNAQFAPTEEGASAGGTGGC